MSKRNSFYFRHSYLKAIESLPEKEQLALWWAIINLGLEDEVTELSGRAKELFEEIGPQIEADHRNPCLRRELKKAERDPFGRGREI